MRLTRRQVFRLLKAYRDAWAVGAGFPAERGKPSNRSYPAVVAHARRWR